MEQKQGFVEKGGLWVLAQIVLLFAAFLVPSWTGVPRFDTGNPAQVTGLAITLMGALFFLAGMRALGSALTPYPQPKEGAELRSNGVYALARHPLYGGLIVATLGWTIFRLSPWGLITWLVLSVFFDRKASREETWLAAKYPEYANYQKRSKKLIPWIY